MRCAYPCGPARTSPTILLHRHSAISHHAIPYHGCATSTHPHVNTVGSSYAISARIRYHAMPYRILYHAIPTTHTTRWPCVTCQTHVAHCTCLGRCRCQQVPAGWLDTMQPHAIRPPATSTGQGCRGHREPARATHTGKCNRASA